MTYVYFISNQRKSVVKIGIANNPTQRLKTFQTANHEKLIILKVIKRNNRTKAFQLESALHRKFKKFHIQGEWFKLTHTIETFIENYQPDEPSSLDQWIVYFINTIFLLSIILLSVVILK